MTIPIAQPPRARPFVLVGLGVGAAVVLLFVVSNLDRDRPASSAAPRIANATDIVAPSPLTDAERRGEGQGLENGPMVQLEQGAWVQVTDETGRLAQQYSAESVEPLPDRQMRLERPKAMIFQPDGRVILLSADHGKARVPKRALETGTLNDHVEIRLFRPQAGRPVDTTKDEPAIVVKADDAHFDNIIGEIRCEGPIHLESDAGTFDGEGMSMLLDPKGGELERLVIDRCTKPMVFVRGADGRTRPQSARPAPLQPVSSPPGSAAVASAPATSAPTAPQKLSPFYRLTLSEDVRVIRVKDGRTSTLKGDELTAVFALEGGAGLDRLVETTPQSASPGLSAPVRQITAAAFAATGPDLQQPETITIDFVGRLLLEPAEEKERLASKDDISVEIRANDGHVVTLNDESSKADVICQRVTFQTGEDLVEAFGSEDRPLTVDSPRLKARGQRFWLKQRAGQGGFSGPGTVTLASGGEAFALFAFDPDTAMVTRDASGELIASALTPASVGPSTVDIGWREALDLTFAPTGDGGGPEGQLELAAFRGAVTARGEAFALDAATLVAAFGADDVGANVHDDVGHPTGVRSRDLQRITASGNDENPVVARRADGAAALAAQSLDLRLRLDASGNAAPAMLVADRSVEAHDAKQTLWTSRLSVTFLDRDAKALPQGSDAISSVGADIATVEGREGVQAMLRGPQEMNIRVFGDSLDGDGPGRTLAVSGKDVWVVRDRVLADRMGQLQFDDATRTAISVGPGRVRAFREVVAPSGDAKAERPALPEGVALQAEWKEGFLFDERAADGNGAIQLRGDVKVRSTPDRASTDAVDAASLRLELAGGHASAAATGSDPLTGAGDVRLVKAEGGAKFESRRWQSAAREGDPRLLRLSGEHIEFALDRREGFVEGPGALLVHVPDSISDATPQPAKDLPPANGTDSFAGAPIPFAAEGTTDFRWLRRMEMVSTGPQRSMVTLREDVQVRHMGIKTTDPTLRLTAARLEADLEQFSAESNGTQAAGATLAGTAKLLAVRAFGEGPTRVLVKSDDFDLECDGLTYDVTTQIAILTGTEGRRVKVLPTGSPAPTQAERVVWNMATGRIQIEGATGAAGR